VVGRLEDNVFIAQQNSELEQLRNAIVSIISRFGL
jgi:hypothetical protein